MFSAVLRYQWWHLPDETFIQDPIFYPGACEKICKVAFLVSR